MNFVSQTIGKYICQFKGHRWNYRSRTASNEKQCARCGLVKPVKRKVKESA